MSSSDVTYVQLYHAGLFNIPNGEANQCHWLVTELDGTFVHETTTSGNFAEQSFMYFDHNVSTEDSMEVILSITNPTNGTICTITDTLYWQAIEVIPGTFIFNWAILNNSVGIEENIQLISDALAENFEVNVFPIPAQDFLQLESKNQISKVEIYSIDGKSMSFDPSDLNALKINISTFPAGIYLCKFYSSQLLEIDTTTIVKL